MILPDVNVLVYAFRSDADRHALCKQWLEGVQTGDARFAISPLALAAMVRISTDGRIFRQPSATDEALFFCNEIMRHPLCSVVQAGERHWSIFGRLCAEAKIRGPRITDAWYAALAIEHGCTWITFDRDYARFPGLDWRAPA